MRSVTTRMPCGCVVVSEPGEYATCLKRHDADVPDHIRARRARR